MSTRNGDRGSASVWVLGIGLLVLLFGVAFAWIGAATAARQRAQVAADLGALAGGVEVVVDPAGACIRAGAVVAANRARLLGCVVDEPDIVVTAAVDAPPFGTARAVARAGPARSPAQGTRDSPTQGTGVTPGTRQSGGHVPTSSGSQPGQETRSPRLVAGRCGRWLDGGGSSYPRRGGRMELSLSTYTVGDHTVLEVGGEVDVYTAPRLRERLIELVEGGARNVVVDLSRVEFLDSTGLGVLVGALKRLRAVNGTLGLVCAHERLLKIFRITALDRVFALYDSVEAATSGGGADPGETA
jgi:anti-sigma B factor antagonist